MFLLGIDEERALFEKNEDLLLDSGTDIFDLSKSFKHDSADEDHLNRSKRSVLDIPLGKIKDPQLLERLKNAHRKSIGSRLDASINRTFNFPSLSDIEASTLGEKHVLFTTRTTPLGLFIPGSKPGDDLGSYRNMFPSPKSVQDSPSFISPVQMAAKKRKNFLDKALMVGLAEIMKNQNKK